MSIMVCALMSELPSLSPLCTLYIPKIHHSFQVWLCAAAPVCRHVRQGKGKVKLTEKEKQIHKHAFWWFL